MCAVALINHSFQDFVAVFSINTFIPGLVQLHLFRVSPTVSGFTFFIPPSFHILHSFILFVLFFLSLHSFFLFVLFFPSLFFLRGVLGMGLEDSVGPVHVRWSFPFGRYISFYFFYLYYTFSYQSLFVIVSVYTCHSLGIKAQ